MLVLCNINRSRQSKLFQMELPAKYKTLFDGVKAFPEMAKEILPIIEELVHFHNCICLLRRGNLKLLRKIC